jgi:hypothetical protein
MKVSDIVPFLFFVVHILFHFDFCMDFAIDYVLFTFYIILFIDVKYKRFFLQQLWKAYPFFYHIRCHSTTRARSK